MKAHFFAEVLVSVPLLCEALAAEGAVVGSLPHVESQVVLDVAKFCEHLVTDQAFELLAEAAGVGVEKLDHAVVLLLGDPSAAIVHTELALGLPLLGLTMWLIFQWLGDGHNMLPLRRDLVNLLLFLSDVVFAL